MTFSKINSLSKALLIVVVLFLKVKIRKVLRCNIVSSEDLLLSLFIVIVNVIVIFMLSYLCHLIRKFSNFSQFYLSLVSFFCIHMKRVFAFLYYAVSFMLVIAIVLCQLFWDCADSFVNIFNVHNDFNATNNFIRF